MREQQEGEAGFDRLEACASDPHAALLGSLSVPMFLYARLAGRTSVACAA
jgi:hypothetical protein